MRSALLFLAALMPFGVANAATVTQTVDVVDTATRTQDRGDATLIREDNLFRLKVTTTLLNPTHAYILLIFTYQTPLACEADPCDFISDLAGSGGDPTVNATAVHLTAGRFIADIPLQFAGKLERGAVGLTGRQVLEGTGVYNMFASDVQVLIRDMGVAGNQVDEFEQLTDYRAGCTDNGGANQCGPVQIATFRGAH